MRYLFILPFLLLFTPEAQAQFPYAEEIQADRGAIQLKKSAPVVQSTCGQASAPVDDTLVIGWGVDPRDIIVRTYSQSGFRVSIIQELVDRDAVLAEFKEILKARPVSYVILSMHGASCSTRENEIHSYLFPGAEPEPALLEAAEEGGTVSCSEVERRTNGLRTNDFLEIIADASGLGLQAVIVDACFQVVPDVDFPILVSGNDCSATMEGIVSAIAYAIAHCDVYDVSGPLGEPDGKISLLELLALEDEYRVEEDGLATEEPIIKNDWAVNKCAIDYFETHGGGFSCKESAPTAPVSVSR